MARFKPGNTEGSKHRAGGRPTKQAAAEKTTLREAIERELEQRSSIYAKRYLEMAQEDPATMRHLIDKVMPNAKTTVAVEEAGNGMLEKVVRKLRELRERGELPPIRNLPLEAPSDTDKQENGRG